MEIRNEAAAAGAMEGKHDITIITTIRPCNRYEIDTCIVLLYVLSAGQFQNFIMETTGIKSLCLKIFGVRIVVGNDITAGFTCLYHLPGGLIETLIVQ